MTTAISVLIETAARGLTLRAHEGNLIANPRERCSPEFVSELRAHKAQLLALLVLPFVMVRASTLDNEILFFCADDDTKAALLKAGADEWTVYTKAELQLLVEQNRVAPISADELRKLHEIKKTFNAKIAP